MASLTFMARAHHVNIRTNKPKRLTGLAAVANPNTHLNVTIRFDGIVHKEHAHICQKEGGYYVSVGSLPNVCRHLNTANAKQSFPTVEVALTAIASWIKMEVTRIEASINS